MSAAEFARDVRTWERSFAAVSDLLVQRVALTVGENLVAGGAYGPGTPVDTGFLRSSWRAGVNDDVRGEGVAGTSEAPTPAPDLGSSVVGARPGDRIVFTNSAEYAPVIEDGRSEQAPAGFVAPVVANFDQIVRDEGRALGL